MNRSLQIAFALFSLSFCIFLIRVVFAGPEAKIRQQLEALEELVSYQAKESDISSLTKVKRLGSLFTEDVHVSIQVPGIRKQSVQGRDQIQAAALAARKQANSLNARLVDIEILVSDDATSATVEATGHATVTGETNPALQDFLFTFKSTENGWLISKVESVDSLR
ncbi:MAG: nuclear transport factor 2 family protein [Coraliomargarita sp.]